MKHEQHTLDSDLIKQAEIADRRFWDNQQTVDSFINRPINNRVLRRLQKINDPHTKASLDLGCGGGRHTQLMLEMGFNTYSCDRSSAMLRATRKRLESQSFNNAAENLRIGSITNIPFGDSVFDCVVASGVLHQARSLEEYEVAIEEVSRVLKVGGVLITNVFIHQDNTEELGYKSVEGHPYTVITKEGLLMTLLPKEVYFDIFKKHSFYLEPDEVSFAIKPEKEGERALLRCNFVKQITPQDIILTDNFISINKGANITTLRNAESQIDSTNPFLQENYDFDEGFYNGVFEFNNPGSGELSEGTSEEYGRRRISAFLNQVNLTHKTIVDIGAGVLNIERDVVSKHPNEPFNFINLDISGPWSNPNQSSLDTGSERLLTLGNKNISTINIQHDLNEESWPLKPDTADYIVSCMALHHIKPEIKFEKLNAIYSALKPGGSLILMDCFTSRQEGSKFTLVEARGPKACKGHPQDVIEFIDMLKSLGFEFDVLSNDIIQSGVENITDSQIELSVKDLSLIMPVSHTTWYMNVKKPNNAV